MRKFWGVAAVALGGAIIAGCATTQQPQIGTDEAMTLLRSGRPILRCREACLDDWRRIQPQAQGFAAAAQWQDLAVLVVRTGYQDDLSLYYLGRAAEGLKNQPAAISYYQQSLQLSGTSIACTTLSRQCGGVALPAEASLRLAALQRVPSRSRRAPPQGLAAPPAQEFGAPPASPSGDVVLPPAGPILPVAAPPPAAPPPPPPAAVPPPAAPPDAGEYIEPPPARR